jgi:hypothetical protein
MRQPVHVVAGRKRPPIRIGGRWWSAPASIRFAVLTVILGGATVRTGAAGQRESAIATPVRQRTWHTANSENFRLCADVASSDFPAILEHLESRRAELAARWLGAEAPPPWRPRCHVVLHATRREYARAVGTVSSSGASTIDYDNDGVSRRRIDVCTAREDWLDGTLVHELTHVVVADGFAQGELPIWADEGMALAADTESTRARHESALREAAVAGQLFPLVELVTLRRYPEPDRWAAFYAQSLSLVDFLTEQAAPDRFVDFVKLAEDRGFDAAAREIYGLENVASLDRLWRSHLAARAGGG